MDDEKFQDRFDRIEKRLEEGFAQVHGLIDALASTCVREFASINLRFTSVDSRLEVIEEKMEALAQRVDNEVEARHAVGEGVSKLEKVL
jgi:tetrahydromethanopterin S-methyltransferase subunit G